MRVRVPIPRGLLLDNPVFPVAVSGPGGIDCDLEGTVAIRSLALSDRRLVAVQLMAGAALAAEFDLWPGRSGLRGARAKRSSGGYQAVFGAFPMPLATVHARLGGGDAALEITRNAVLEAVAEVSGLDVEDLRPGNGLGFFLEGALRHSPVLRERPVEQMVARCLWAYQWDLPTLPDEGEIVFWKVCDPVMAHRLGGAMWAALQRDGRSALLAHSGASINADGSERVLVIVGRHSDEVLAGIDGWAGRRGRAAVVIGSFPPGWDPPVPPIECSQSHGRPMAVTGVSLDTALRVAEEREGRFDPWNEADRRALTEAACDLFEQSSSGPGGAASGAVDPVYRALSLRVEGLDRTTLVALSGLHDAALMRKVAEGTVVVDGDRWRLPTAPRLRKDTLHAQIAKELSEDDPERYLHQALAGEEIEPLIRWARSQLDQLRYEAVREILGLLEPGALGDEIDALRAESCLAGLDLAGARQAVAAMNDGVGDPWRLWLDLEDHDDHWEPPDLDPEFLLEAHPRIAAELAVHTLRRLKKTETKGACDAEALLDRSIERLGGHLANWYSILREAVLRPKMLDDAEWVETIAGNSERLGRLAAHKRVLSLTWRGEWAEARCVLRGLVEVVRSPGRLGRMFIDLANVTTDQGEEIACLLRAHRLLEAAGFRQKTHNVVFNLAMIDIERLRLDRAEARLKTCARGNDPLHSFGEGLLSLARGDLDTLSAVIGGLPDDVAEMRVREGCHMLRGLGTLFEGRWGPARRHLQAGGVESLPWARLLDAAEGKAGGAQVQEDPWGVGVAATLVERVRENGRGVDLQADGTPSLETAFAFALADAVLPTGGWLCGRDREVIAAPLSDAGMEGWAQRIRGQLRADFEIFSDAATRVAGAASLQALGQNDWEAICGSLGLTGLEVRSEIDGKILWRWGNGEACGPARPGSVSLIPLGGLPTSSGAWRLLETLVESIVPPTVEIEGNDTGDTLGIAGSGEPIRSLRQELRRFAPSRLTVLLAGETGVGKGLAAEAIHKLSGRKGRFVSVNAAAVTGTLFEAELYGAVKGAFTGADRDRAGMAEEADGGTLFLDEIGDLDLSLQVKLLRFLDSGEVRRVGSGRTRNFDVRVVAASHRDLESMVADGAFRQDLYYRMGSAKIIVPPLRERGRDVLTLKDLFVRTAVRDQNLKPARWSREADAVLLAHHWPGNIRELHKAVEVALVQADGGVVGPEHLPPDIGANRVSEIRLWEEAHRDLRIELIRSSLERNDGNRAATARELGLSRQTLLYHMKLLGLK
ncbi:MAG: sigma 54-interacting transcriptional regulator [Acidobacteriota bacterium]